MAARKTDLAVFDLDGTLAATAPQIALAVQSAMRLAGLSAPTQEEICHYIGNGAAVLVKRAMVNRIDYREEEIDPGIFARVTELYRQEYLRGLDRNFTLYPGVPEILALLKREGLKLALATNKPDYCLAPWLAAAGLTGVFDFALGSGVLPVVKPDPGILLHVCGKLDVPVARSVMVGDSGNDILAAKACGMRSVGMTYGYCYTRPLKEFEPDFLLDDFRDLPGILLA